MNQLIVPDTGVQLVDGSIVILSRFPGTKWIVHNGWYTYEGQQYLGWYFCSIPAQQIMPVNSSDLRLLTVVDSKDSACYPNPGPPPCPPPAPPSNPGCNCNQPEIPFTPKMAFQLDRAWISVETEAQRDELTKRLLPNGKIVRVNQMPEGGSAYFRWNQVTEAWETETFGIDTSNFLTETAANDLYASKSDLTNLETSIDTKIDSKISTAVGPAVSDAIKNDASVNSAIKSIVTDTVPSVINDNEDVDKIISDKVDTALQDDDTIPKIVETEVKNQMSWNNLDMNL